MIKIKVIFLEKKRLPRNKELKKYSTELRNKATPEENKLWYEFLRNYPVRFQRQKAIGDYIADFYSAKARLIIELDGSEHFTAQQYAKDAIRTKNLEQMDLTVVRISNRDIFERFQSVCEYIDRMVKQSLPQSIAEHLTAPSSEGAEG